MSALQPGDLLFVRTQGIIGAAIRWLSRSSVNHVALAIDERRILEIQPEFGVKAIENPYRTYIRGRYVHPLTVAQLSTIVSTATSIIGRKYDWSLIGAIMFRLLGWKSPWFRDLPCRWICTEGADVAYLSAGIDLLPETRTSDVTPEELLRSPWLRFDLIEEGGD